MMRQDAASTEAPNFGGRRSKLRGQPGNPEVWRFRRFVQTSGPLLKLRGLGRVSCRGASGKLPMLRLTFDGRTCRRCVEAAPALRRCGTRRQSIRHGPIFRTQAGAIPARGISGNRKQLVPLMRQDAASTCRSGILPLRRCSPGPGDLFATAQSSGRKREPFLHGVFPAIESNLVRLMRQDAASKCRSGILPLRRCGTTAAIYSPRPNHPDASGSHSCRCIFRQSKATRSLDAAGCRISQKATAVAAEGN